MWIKEHSTGSSVEVRQHKQNYICKISKADVNIQIYKAAMAALCYQEFPSYHI